MGQIGLEIFVWNMERDVGNDCWIVEEERFVLVCADEGEGLLVDTVWCVVFSFVAVVAGRIGWIRITR